MDGQLTLAITSVDDVIDYIYKTCHDERQKGDMWERVSRYYLLSDPLYSSELIGKIWLWADAPTNDLGPGGSRVQDTGIDLVAEDLENPGQFWAIQCKCYDKGKTLPYKECSTFWSTAQADKRYSRYMLISTTKLISKNIVDMVNKTPTLLIAPSDMDAANIDWSGVLTDEKSLKERVTFDLRDHQEIAVKSINKAFDDEGYDRCKAIMACGTGKTLMSLRLAEGRANGGLVLFAAPSIALVSQAMREWTNQARVDLRTLVVCSDAQASSLKEEDTILDTIADLAYPATTDPSKLVERYRAIRDRSGECMVAVCSTYQSMQVIEDAQKMGLPEFDLIICDEAHRTTGYKSNGESNEDISSFLIVHDNDRVHGSKRLYMTATPRIYGDQAKRIGAKQDYVLTSMDDETIFGKTAYEIPFSEAVERDLLCDYRVVVMAVREEAMPRDMQRLLSDGSELQMDEAAKIIGCYKGLATHGEVSQQRLDAMFEEDSYEIPDFFLIDTLDEENIPETEREIKPLNRAVGFCLDIKSSKRVDEMFGPIVEQYLKNAREEERYDLYCSLDHVDGGMNSKTRHSKLDWLAGGQDDEECRILTNARCLAEGVDVPSLDAVIFFSPRKSEVDVVQAVGRVMRSFTNPKTGEKKKLGYIILPVFIPEGKSPEEALNDNKTFDVVWKVLQALRSHDERIEAYVNSLQFRKKKERKAGIGRAAGNGSTEVVDDDGSGEQFQIDFNERLAEAIYTKTVDKVGTRIYWDTWAEDVAHIAERHIEQINKAIDSDPVAKEGFRSFIKGLRDSLNPGISEGDAIEMVAQHMITLPVFDALFGDFEFASSNPVSIAITEFLKSLAGHGVGDMSEADEAALDALYSSVERRAKMARTDNGRQALIKNLYEDFFRKAFKATTDKLGIVYTPDEIIDYILYATDRVLRRDFGKSLADEGVHILDPFAGTGSFTARLIEDKVLMPDDKLPYKYACELHSNEILLLAYYIMVVNVEYAYHSRTGEYKEFNGALLTDTFQMTEEQNTLDDDFFQDNTLRLLHQRDDIRPLVCFSNPPYSMGQKNEDDGAKNAEYETLDNRIRETYRKLADSNPKNALYDSYIRAFRWASDRIGEYGVIGFVSNGGWLRNGSFDGFRRSLIREFDDIYVMDLRGNQRTQGEESRREGGKVFGSGSRAPIAITILVRKEKRDKCGTIHYVDVGDYKTQVEKLEFAKEAAVKEPEWTILKPDRYGDWLDQRDDSYLKYAPMGVAEGNTKTDLGMWSIWSRGVGTGRDPWAVGYSRETLEASMKGMIRFYEEEQARYQAASGVQDIDSFLRVDTTKISWSYWLKQDLMRGKTSPFSPVNVREIAYRPFCKQYLYFDSIFNNEVAQIKRIFPTGEKSENVVLVINGANAGGDFSCLISNITPDLHLVGTNQCFPLYWYEPLDGTLPLGVEESAVIEKRGGMRYVRHDAITDRTLLVFQSAYPMAYETRAKKYGGRGINKEDIFYYVYGILHSTEYRRRFATNLAKELPRIPLAESFESFAEAGRKLADLHLNYEGLSPYPTVQIGLIPGVSPGPIQKMRWAKKKDPDTGKRVNDYTTLIFNPSVTVTGIPETAQSYTVNGRSPLDWMIDRYQVKVDKKSGIKNDPNEYSSDPCYILSLIGKLVRVAMETSQIVTLLPPIKEVPYPANWPAEWSSVG